MSIELTPIKIEHGESKAWEHVCGLSPKDVCSRVGATFDEKLGGYRIVCFGTEFLVNPCEMMIKNLEVKGEIFLGKLKDFFRLSVLWYMKSALDIPLSGRLLRPIDLKGGHRFSTGTHVLPLELIAQKYKADTQAFLQRGLFYGGKELKGYADAGFVIYPLPRVPVTMILWLEDEEFPAKVDLFFDSTCEFHIELSDIIWAVSMMCCVLMLEE